MRVLPAPWVFDERLRPLAAPSANRWRVESKGRRKMRLKHVKTKTQLDLSCGHVLSAAGRDLLVLAVQLVLYRGVVELLPLPPGYWK